MDILEILKTLTEPDDINLNTSLEDSKKAKSGDQ